MNNVPYNDAMSKRLKYVEGLPSSFILIDNEQIIFDPRKGVGRLGADGKYHWIKNMTVKIEPLDETQTEDE